MVSLLDIWNTVLGAQHLVPATLPGPILGSLFLDFLKISSHIRNKVDGLIEIRGAEGVVLDELDIVVRREVALAIVSDTVHHSDPEILNCPQQVLVSDQVSPNCTTIRQLNLL